MNALRDVLFIIFTFEQVKSQCTFPSPFASSTWLDSTRGTLVFTSTQVTGWSATILNQQISSWDCHDNSSDSRLVLKSTTRILYSTINIDVYACLVLTKITDNSYTYVQQQIQVPDAGYHRLLFSNQAVAVSSICNSAASIPTLDFHVLVKQGMGSSAAINFPNNLLVSVDYEYRESDGTVACNGTQEALDMCTDQTQLAVNYSYCPQQIAYTAGGRAWCVATKSLSGYDCAVVMNQDVTISGTATQFACICSNGNKMSVVANNCTTNQSPASYPTAADGVTVIGYLLHVTNTLVSCGTTTTAAPEEESSSSTNIGLIVGIVVVVVVLVAIVIISFILYKTGRCIVICGHVKGCLKKTPCWGPFKNKLCVCCNKNKVAESEKPILTNENTLRVETITETANSARSKRSREKSAVSAISRSSTMGVNREKSDLDKSLITRQATATSIGLDLKSEKSTLHTVKVKPAETEEKAEEETKKESVLSFLPCFRSKDVPKEEEPPEVKEEKEETKPETKGKKKPITPKGKKGATGKKGTGKKAKAETDKKGKKAKQTTVKSAETSDDEVPAEEPTLTAASKIESPRDTKKEQKAKQEKKTELVRAPTKMNSDLLLTSTPVPGSEKGKKAVVSVPAGLVKPEDKRTEWTFLSCCFGKRSPPPPDEDSPPAETNEVPIVAPTQKKKAPSKADKKGKGNKKGGGGGKSGGKKGGKNAGKKPDVNGNDVVVEDIADEVQFVERSKSMPDKQREKTTLSMKDAEKVQVDVYIPDDKTNLQLKDTVIVKEKNGEPQLIKAKTDIGLVRPASSSSRPASSMKTTKKSETKKAKKSGEKSKDGTKSGGKDKKKKKK